MPRAAWIRVEIWLGRGNGQESHPPECFFKSSPSTPPSIPPGRIEPSPAADSGAKFDTLFGLFQYERRPFGDRGAQRGRTLRKMNRHPAGPTAGFSGSARNSRAGSGGGLTEASGLSNNKLFFSDAPHRASEIAVIPQRFTALLTQLHPHKIDDHRRPDGGQRERHRNRQGRRAVQAQSVLIQGLDLAHMR